MLFSEAQRFALLMTILSGFVTALYVAAASLACIKLATSTGVVDRIALAGWIAADLTGVLLGYGSCFFWSRQRFRSALFVSFVFGCFTGLVIRAAS